ncbi:trans-aconitate 2-methyltransferase [Hahella sp. CCB-MM4]|uniref:class I SAM-dependent methyltransferase n=1 Tax=Hahella sp. (strain CCB-MM4) TaxID=1926491 RepID=UPI000B9A37A8|nr:class I SAM-dependent methyltransferase [Hahella sp. CCB-MM4]
MQIDTARVRHYFDRVSPSLMGPYMMDGFGFPQGAGKYRLKKELAIAESLLSGLENNDLALDLGSGVGHWTQWLASRFRRVESVEASRSLYEQLELRCQRHLNVHTYCGNALSYQPSRKVDLAFLGGLLMYLSDDDNTKLLTHLRNNLSTTGVILARESTVRSMTQHKQGDYSVIYRTIKHYEALFADAGLELSQIQLNTAYELLQIGCETVKHWKSSVPQKWQMLPVVGGSVYWGLRASSGWLPGLLRKSDREFPVLQNHFFLLRPKTARRIRP